MSEQLQSLRAGERVVFGGDRVTTIPAELADEFCAGDRLVVVHETGALLHIPHAEHAVAAAAVDSAVDAFAAVAQASDHQISEFFEQFAARLEDDESFAAVAAANATDVERAATLGRATGRLTLSAGMRADMIAGLRTWRDIETRRSQRVAVTEHA